MLTTQAHRQLEIKAEAASKASSAEAAAGASSSRKSLELREALSPEKAARMAMVAEGRDAYGGGAGGVRDLIIDNAGRLSFEDDSKASSPRVSGGSANMGDFMKGAMGFFSPKSQARHKKLMFEEDERRESSFDIMGESSKMIAALKAEVGIPGCVLCFFYAPELVKEVNLCTTLGISREGDRVVIHLPKQEGQTPRYQCSD